jgi:hypothetical protein
MLPNMPSTLHYLLGASLLLAADVRADEAPASAPAATHWYDSIDAHAFISASYTYNFNQPKGMDGSPGLNQYRSFDIYHDSFNLDVAELSLQNAASGLNDVGFRIDFMGGSTLPQGAAPAGLTTGKFAIYQGYGSWVAPVGRGLRIDVGVFGTPLGGELVEGVDGANDTYSHSFLFGFGEPFTHTGIRLTYQATDIVNIIAFVANGWDNAIDNNSGKTGGLQVEVDPTSATKVLLTGVLGPERSVAADGTEDTTLRSLIDLVASITEDDFAFTFTFDWGHEGDADWFGGAGTLRWDFSKHCSVALRGEVFDDKDGVRTALPGGQTLDEITLTPAYKIGKTTIIRVEFRWDHSNHDVFVTDTAGEKSGNQVTAALNWVSSF